MQCARGGQIAAHGPNVARRSIQENLQICKFLQLLIVIVNISAEAINRVLLLLS